MAKHSISADFTKTYEIEKSGDSWTFEKTFSVTSNAIGIDVAEQYDGNDISILDKVHGDEGALRSLADNATIHVASSAKLTGGIGIALNGNNISVVNDSKIAVTAAGVFSYATNLTLTNNNTIKAESAVYIGENSHVINAQGAAIIGTTIGVGLGGSSLVNHGTITATINAILGGDGDTIVVNDGTITGNIDLGAGNDQFDNRGGVVVNDIGGVVGYVGNDLLITDSAKVKLIEDLDEGTDTVKSTVSYKLSANVEKLFLLGASDANATGTNLANTLHGNSGDNVIKGLLGSDQLFGHKGNDILTGGTGGDGDGDTFHFLTGDGKDVVTDFENGFDLVDVSGWTAITDFNDLMQHHIQFKNGDVVITAGQDVLRLTGVAEADVDAGDFLFA